MKQYFRNKYILLIGVIVVYCIAIIPLVLLTRPKNVISYPQDHRAILGISSSSRVCSTTGENIMVVLDTSSTMNTQDSNSDNYLASEKVGAMDFVASVSAKTNNLVGLVSYNTNATLMTPLSTNFSQVTNAISSLSTTGYTCISCGLNAANEEIGKDRNPGSNNAIVLITNGQPDESDPQTASTSPQADALLSANLSATTNTKIYPVSIGPDVDADFLGELATQTNGQYFYSPSTLQFPAIMSIVASQITKKEQCSP